MFTCLGRAAPPALRLRQRLSSHTSITGVLDEQAERHGAQIFAAKADRETVRGRILFCCQSCVNARRQGGAQRRFRRPRTGWRAVRLAISITVSVAIWFDRRTATPVQGRAEGIAVCSNA